MAETTETAGQNKMNELTTTDQKALKAESDLDSALFSFDQAQPWAACIEAWLQAKSRKSGSHNTIRAYQKVINDWLAFLTDLGRNLSQAGGVEVSAYIDRLQDQGNGESTVNARLAALSSFYRFASTKFTLNQGGREITLISYNPIDRAERSRIQPYGKAKKISLDHLAAILAIPNRTTVQGQRDYSILLTFLYTGRRLAELARLKWGDLQVGTKVYYSYRGKRGKLGTRQLPPPAWAAIRDYLETSGRWATMEPDSPLWVAHTDNAKYLPNVGDLAADQPLSVSMITKIVKRASRRGTGQQVTPHSLRHAAAALRKKAGGDVVEIQQFLDHSSLATTQIYLDQIITQDDESWLAVAELLNQ